VAVPAGERYRGRRFVVNGEAPPGLYLKPPHGELSFTGAKRALAKAREFGIEGQPFVLCSGPSAWGELVLGGPEAVGVDEFDARFGEHRVSVKERAKWWPDEERLYIYPYAEWRAYERPRRVVVPASVQTLMGPVEFLGDKEANVGQGVTININAGTDAVGDFKLMKAMAGDGEAIAELDDKARGEGRGAGGSPQGDGGADKCVCPECGHTADHEKGTPCADVECPECETAMEGKDEEEKTLKVWKPADATEHTQAADTPEKKRQWASTANSVRKDCLDAISGEPTDAQVSNCEGKAVRIANAAIKKGKKEAIMDHRSKQVQDELSLSDIQSLMWDALSPQEEQRPYAMDVDVYDDYVTYQLEGKHYIRSYAVVDGKLQLGEAIEAEVIIRPKSVAELPEGYKTELVQEFDALELGDKGLSDDEKVALTSAQRRALPDSSYAWVETGEGCEKEDGKRPQKCRHLPYKHKDGSLDCARVRNARGRIPQMTGVPQAAKDKITKAQTECTKRAEGGGKGLSLEPLREQADKALEAVVGFWKAVTGDGAEAALALEGETGFKTFEADDGQTWILTWTTNAFLDRDEEIFSTRSIEEYAERAWKEIQETGSKGQYDFWHAPGSEFADITWVGAIGRFLVEMGTFKDDEAGRCLKKFFTECPEAQKDIAPEGWKASHRFKFRPWDKADGVYNWFDKDRTSVLAAHRAANPYTAMEVLEKMLNDEQKEMLKKVGEATGVDLLGIVQETEDETKRLEDANVAHKAKDGEEGKEPPKETPKEDETADEQVEDIAKRVASMMGLEELGKMLQGLLDSNEAIKGELTKVVGRLDEVEKGDLKRIEDKDDWRPHVPWFRASKADSTILDDTKDDDKDLKGKQPEVPQAIQRVTDRILGQPPAGGSA